MARTNPAGERWALWLNDQLTQREWRQADLLNALGDRVARQTVNNWVSGKYAADADTAYVIAVALGTPPSDALRAAGYEIIADAFAGQALRLAGSKPEPGPEPVDEVIDAIMARRGLTQEQQAKLITRYRRRLADLQADTKDILDTVAGPRENARGTARGA